jgi:hypothetical protein
MKWVTLSICTIFSLFIHINTHAANIIIAKNLGKLYYAVNPINEMNNYGSIKIWVANNAHLMQENSPTILLARELGQRLIQGGLAAFNRADFNNAYESCLNMGANADQANKVAQSLQQGSADAYALGVELLWIARVIPKAANGDWSDYESTGTQLRLTLRQLYPIYAAMGDLSLLNHYMVQFQDYIEYQVAYLALIY